MNKLTPIKSIRLKCLDCCAGIPKEVRECPIEECPLYQFRLGTNPNITRGKRKGSIEALSQNRAERKKTVAASGKKNYLPSASTTGRVK